MDSNITENDALAAFMASHFNGGNFTSICSTKHRIHSRGLFFNTNPLQCSFPLLLFQCSITSGITLLIFIALKRLGQPLVIAQIIGGILLGPSGLGWNASYMKTVFPISSFVLIDVISSFAYMFYFFLLGVQMDPWILKKIDRKTSAIGFSVVVLPMALTAGSYFFLSRFFVVDPKLAKSLHIITQAESVQAFPVVAYILSELKLINSDFGRLAMSASTVCAIPSLLVMILNIVSFQAPGNNFKIISILSAGIAVMVVIIFVIRPAVLWMIKNHPEEEPIAEKYIVVLFLGVPLMGFFCQATGLNTYFGPLVLGMAIPAGPPLGSALIEKLEVITSWMLMPTFFLKIGLMIDLNNIRFKSYMIVQFVALVAVMGKFSAAFFTSLYYRIPARDAIALGLVLNVQGVLELGLYKAMERGKMITHEAFVIMTMSLVIVTGVTTPILRYLYDPSRKFTVYQRRTVMHRRPNSELHVLVCLHDKENVPTAINLLEALNPTRQNSLEIYLLHLIELKGWARPRLIFHKKNREAGDKASSSIPIIINAFANYENSKDGAATIHPFTSISPSNAMHEDVFAVALNKNCNLIIAPFYKKLLPDGETESYRKAARILNNNVLEKAPCSVAIFIDRGLLSSSRPQLEGWSSFRVAVLFLGGPDDREALAIAARMTAHPNINLTMIRLVENGNVNNGDVNERRLDNEAVCEFKVNMDSNYQVMYIEEVVMDGTGTISVIRSLENNYELVMVGRHHDKNSRFLFGLVDWSEQTELGAIAEVLATKDFASNATILVVQQHTNFVKESKATNVQKVTCLNTLCAVEDNPTYRLSIS